MAYRCRTGNGVVPETGSGAPCNRGVRPPFARGKTVRSCSNPNDSSCRLSIRRLLGRGVTVGPAAATNTGRAGRPAANARGCGPPRHRRITHGPAAEHAIRTMAKTAAVAVMRLPVRCSPVGLIGRAGRGPHRRPDAQSPAGPKASFASPENMDPTAAPTLTLIPQPSAAALLAGAPAVLLRRRRRRGNWAGGI